MYVEPMAFARAAESFVLAGEPLYAWKPRDTSRGGAQLDTAEALLGVVFERSGHVAALPKPPLNGTLTNVRLLADGEQYAAVFALTKKRTRGGQEPALLGYWFGRTDGKTWHSLEQLPLPPSGDLNTREASRLVRVAGVLMIAAPFGTDARQDVAVFTRKSEGWSVETVPARGTAYVALTESAALPFLYVVRPDTTRDADANSLSLFVRASGSWRPLGFLVHGGRQPVHHPTVVAQDDIQILSWIEDDEVSRTRSARAARLRPDGTLGSAVTLARGIEDVIPVHDASGSFRWVVSNRTSDGQPTLTLVEWGGRDGEPEIRDVVVNPFTGPALAYSTRDGDVVVGPVMGRSPREELVVSGVLRFALRCGSKHPAERRSHRSLSKAAFATTLPGGGP
jgi:hypothetical protein